MVRQANEVGEETADADRAIGENVQRFRTAKGMSQAQLAVAMAERTGQQVHQQTIVKIEKGTRPLRYSEAVLISEVLDVPVGALAPDDPELQRRALLHTSASTAADSFGEVVTAAEKYRQDGERLARLLLAGPDFPLLPPEQWEAMGRICDPRFITAVRQILEIARPGQWDNAGGLQAFADEGNRQIAERAGRGGAGIDLHAVAESFLSDVPKQRKVRRNAKAQ